MILEILEVRNFDTPMTIMETPNKSFEKVYIVLIDIRSQYYLTIQDKFLKFAQAYLLENKSGQEIFQKLIRFCQHFRIPKRIYSF